MSQKLRGAVHFVVLLGLLSAVAPFGAAQKDKAPTGTYVGTIGQSAAAGGAARAGGGAAARGARRGPEGGPGREITIQINSYSDPIEWSQLEGAQNNPSNFLKALSRFDHGTIKIGPQTYPINAARSTPAGAHHHIYLISAKPLTTAGPGARGRQAAGTAGGYIRLTVDSNGLGDGALYTATQVVVKADGDIQARATAATATKIEGIALQ